MRRAVALLLALACLCAGGCSVAGMIYLRLDWIITTEVDRWLDLERAQKARFRAAIGARLAEHRREELPRWVELLQTTASQVERSAPPEEVLEAIEQSRRLLHRSTAYLIGPLAAAYAELDPAQVEHYRGVLDEDNAEYAEEYLKPTAEARIAKRLEESSGAIERWSGKLDAAQAARLERLVEEIPDGAESWRDHRLDWQAALLELLHADTGAEAFERLLQARWIGDEGMDPAYHEQLARNRELIAIALSELYAMLEPKQRARAARRLRELAEEFEALYR